MSNLKTYKVRSVHLEITGKCNLKCVYCYNSQFNDPKRFKDEMKTEDIKRLIDEAHALGCNQFRFSGGDPFMREDIFEIIKHCKGKKVAFLTNGKKLDRDFIKKLAKYPQVNELKITLDGFEEHNKARVGSDYKKIIESIKIIKQKGIHVVINTEVTENNLKDMPKLYDLLKELKIDRWRVDLPFILGRYKENYLNYRTPPANEFTKTFALILKSYLAKKPTFEFELFNVFKSEITPENLLNYDLNVHPCSYREGSFPMRPNGDMIFCPSFDMPMSNFIKEGSFKNAIDEKYKSNYYDIKISDIKDCQNCRYLKLCGGGCRVDSYYYFNSMVKADPIACNLMPYVEKIIVPVLTKELKATYLKLIDVKGKMPKKYDINKLVSKVAKK